MDEQDIIYMAELEFGHDFVQNNYEKILKSDYEEIAELFYEQQERKEN
jgi:hypothetical protein